MLAAERRKVPPDLSQELLGAVNGLRTEMTRRFGQVDEKLDGVCDDVATLKTQQAVNAALAKQADNVAQGHTLDYRFKLGIIVAAFTGACGLVLGVLNFLAGH